MDKQANQTRQEQRPEPKEFRQEPPQRGHAATLSVLSMSAWAAGIPLLALLPETAVEVASQLGNAAMGELLRGGSVETKAFRLPGGDGGLPENAAHAAPPELADPSGLRCAGAAREAFAPGALLERTASAQGPNLFEAAMAGEQP